jgi:hypothetical protein
MASFWQTGFVLDDYKNREKTGAPEIRGIQQKRYNEEIFLCVSGPDWIFFVVTQNPG